MIEATCSICSNLFIDEASPWNDRILPRFFSLNLPGEVEHIHERCAIFKLLKAAQVRLVESISEMYDRSITGWTGTWEGTVWTWMRDPTRKFDERCELLMLTHLTQGWVIWNERGNPVWIPMTEWRDNHAPPLV